MAYDAILKYDDLNDVSTDTYQLFDANLWQEMDFHRREAARIDRLNRALQQKLQAHKTMTELDFACCVNLADCHREWTPEQIFEKVFGGK